MLQPDSINENMIDVDKINIDNIRLVVENELDDLDTISLVFLLYDIPDTALQHLIIFQRTKDIGTCSEMLIYKWALDQQACPTWKYKLLEALTICQHYRIISKFGFNVNSVKKHYQPDKLYVSVHINPFKKTLYKFCDNMEASTLNKLKRTLSTYNNMQNIISYETGEMVMLELLCQNFITIQKSDSRISTTQVSVKKLTGIISSFQELKSFADILNEIENRYNAPTPKLENKFLVTSQNENFLKKEPEINEDIDDIENEILEEFKNLNFDGLRSDGKETGVYPIIHSERIGFCYIINQEEFYLSEASILANEPSLTDREGSNKDKNLLERTLHSLKFKVESVENISAKEMLQNLKHIVRNEVLFDDSIFVLCILSHGIKGHVYGADTVKVDIEELKKIIDSDEAKHLRNKPKLIIIQACQTVSSGPSNKSHLIPDGPFEHHIKKSDFLVFWATASEYKAYRWKDKGSIFISILCKVIHDNADKEHLKDIFTIVNHKVKTVFTKLKTNQTSSIETDTWTKKFYLKPKA